MINKAIATNTPEGAAFKLALVLRAAYTGNVLLEYRRSIFTDETELRPLNEIAHYFDVNMAELGMIAFPNSTCETVLIHNPPRMWGKTQLARCQTFKNSWKE
jgi:hypothetical protein